jgi:hypothetical protein
MTDEEALGTPYAFIISHSSGYTSEKNTIFGD